MELIKNSKDIHFISAETFTEQLNTLKQQLPHILDDFEKYYVFYNMNPANNEYQTMFENIKKNLNSINSKTFMISNNVESETNNINQKLISLNSLIQYEKESNNKLKSNIDSIEEEKNSTNLMINNYKEMYDVGYLKNWALFLSIIVAGYAIFKISSNKTPVNVLHN